MLRSQRIDELRALDPHGVDGPKPIPVAFRAAAGGRRPRTPAARESRGLFQGAGNHGRQGQKNRTRHPGRAGVGGGGRWHLRLVLRQPARDGVWRRGQDHQEGREQDPDVQKACAQVQRRSFYAREAALQAQEGLGEGRLEEGHPSPGDGAEDLPARPEVGGRQGLQRQDGSQASGRSVEARKMPGLCGQPDEVQKMPVSLRGAGRPRGVR